MQVTLLADDSRPIRRGDRLDLRADADKIEGIEPARKHPPLRVFLMHVNSDESVFSTIGCKAWIASEGEERAVFASSVDLIFLCESTNFGRGPHEDLARRLSGLLQQEAGEYLDAGLCLAPVEFAGDDSGFCLRITLSASGTTAEQAEVRWGLGLARLQQALLFVARGLRQRESASGIRTPQGSEAN